jgi:hypothetical protein
MASSPVTKVTEEEYLALDRAAEFRSEFHYGQLVPRQGVNIAHSRIQCNLYGDLHMALHG